MVQFPGCSKPHPTTFKPATSSESGGSQLWFLNPGRFMQLRGNKVLFSPNTHPSLTRKFTSEHTAIAIPLAAR